MLNKWAKDSDSVDDATDAMRLIAAQDPDSVQSDRFEETRLAAVELVQRRQWDRHGNLGRESTLAIP